MKHSKRNLYILTFVLFVVMLGYGIVIPIMPFYIEQMGAGGTEMGMLLASYAVMRMICGPVWGSLSDRFGRKPILIIGILGYAITMVWFGLATELWMLFAARILAGILSSATAPTTMAYISDSTPENERGGGMGLLGAAGGVGTIIGPVLGGLLGGENLSTPFFAAAGMSILSLLLAWIFLKESIEIGVGREATLSEGILNLPVWAKTIRSPIGSLFILIFFSTCGLMIFASIFGLYALQRFSFGPEDVGLMLMILGLVSATTQGIFIGPLTKKWGDKNTLKFGLLATSFGFILLLLADDYTEILIATAIFGITTALQIPAITSLVSKASNSPQGVVMGLTNSFISLGRIISPLLAGYLLDVNIKFPFISGSFIMIIGFLISLFTLQEIKPELPQDQKSYIPSMDS